MSNDNHPTGQQLTPEAIFNVFSVERYPHKGYFIEAVKQYAAQQTAAKDDRIKELEKEVESLKFKLKDAQSESEYYQSLYLVSGNQ